MSFEEAKAEAVKKLEDSIEPKKKGRLQMALDPVTAGFQAVGEFFKLCVILLPEIIKLVYYLISLKTAELKRLKDAEANAELQAKLGAEREKKLGEDTLIAFNMLEKKVWIDTQVQLTQMIKNGATAEIKLHLQVIKNAEIENLLYHDDRVPEIRAVDLVYIMKNTPMESPPKFIKYNLQNGSVSN
jgi:hypothetical protein